MHRLVAVFGVLLTIALWIGVVLAGVQLSAYASAWVFLPQFLLAFPILFSKKEVVLSPIFLLFLLALFGNVIRYAVLSFNQDLFILRPTLDNITVSEIEFGAMNYGVGILVMSLGYGAMSAIRSLKAPVSPIRYLASDDRVRNILALALSALFIGLLVNYLLSTGFLEDFSAKRILQDDEGNQFRFGPARFVLGIGSVFFQLVFLYTMLNKDTQNRLPIILVSLFFVVLYSFSLSKRSSLLIFFLPLVLVVLYNFRMRMLFRSVVTGVVVLSIVWVITMQRGRTDLKQDLPWTQPFVELFLSSNFSGLISTAISTKVIEDEVDPLLGSTFVIDPVLQFVPRSVWLSKPEELGGRIRQWHQSAGFLPESYNAGGTAPGIISEAWINFRMPGIVLIMFLYGALGRVIYNYYLDHWRHHPLSSATYLSILPIFTLNWFGGHTARFVISTLSLLLAAWLLRMVIQRQPSSPAQHLQTLTR